jgi:hypothetical protein
MLFIFTPRKVAGAPRHWSGDGEWVGRLVWRPEENVKFGLRGCA